MITKEQALEGVRKGRPYERDSCEMVDCRDYYRLIDFFPAEEWHHFGFELSNDAPPQIPLDWTEEIILAHLKSDLDFAFEKSIHHRGISSSLMYNVIKMWLWVLEDDLVNYKRYAPYGMPLYEAVAEKYNFPNRASEYSDEDR